MSRRIERPLQQGAALLFALITLVALTLAAVALVRSVDTGGLVIGNIGFKQDATVSAEQATEAAITWLTTPSRNLETTVATDGYYAVAYTELDATGQDSARTTRTLVDWANNDCADATSGSFTGGCIDSKTASITGGNTAQYVILRLCQNTGPTSGNNCAQSLQGSSTPSADEGSGTKPKGTASTPLYRIVVRVVGARGTTSFTETIVQK